MLRWVFEWRVAWLRRRALAHGLSPTQALRVLLIGNETGERIAPLARHVAQMTNAQDTPIVDRSEGEA